MTDEKMIGTVKKLVDLVDYQKGAVVSRTLIKKEVGTVTLFAFEVGEGLSEHSAPYDAMVHVLEGESEVKIEEKSFIVKAGEIIILPKNRPHSLIAITKFKMLLTMIRQKNILQL